MVNFYKIRVTLVTGKQLTYTVKEYEVLENGLIRFLDNFTGKYQTFDGRMCQIEEDIQNG